MFDFLVPSGKTILGAAILTGAIYAFLPEKGSGRAVKMLCSLLLAVTLLSPILSILPQLDDILTEGDETSSNGEDPYARAVSLMQERLEEGLCTHIQEEYGVLIEVELVVDARDLRGIRVLSAQITVLEELTASERENLSEVIGQMLECEEVIVI